MGELHLTAKLVVEANDQNVQYRWLVLWLSGHIYTLNVTQIQQNIS